MGGDDEAKATGGGLSRRSLLRRAVPWGIGAMAAGGLATGSTYGVGAWLRGWGRVPPPEWAMPLKPPILGAHRGGAGIFPEHTLIAFQSSHERFGARFMETDIRVTRDGVPIVFHDAILDRTTDGSGPVADRTWAELQALDAGFRFRDPQNVSWAGRGVRIPALVEVLRRFPDCVFSVEIKREPAEREGAVAAAVVAAIRQAGMERRVLVGSVSEATVLRVQAVAPDIPSFYSFRSGALLLLATWLGLARWYRPAHNALLIPQRLFGLNYIDADVCRTAHGLGLPMLAWTVNEPAEMERLLRLGVDGIITDRPDLLARVVRA